MKHNKYPSKEDIKYYQAYISVIKEYFKDLPDGAYFAIMVEETKNWLRDNNYKHIDAHDFYIEEGI